MDTDGAIYTWRDGAVAHIRFNRPDALNAINIELAASFREICEGLDESVRAIVISGEGRAFMAGGDLGAMKGDPVGVASRLIDEMHASINFLTHHPAPVIASVHGAVAGAGLGLALSCDLCIAAHDTRFAVAYPLVGTSPDCGTTSGLVRALGLQRAMSFALLGAPISASEALSLGLVCRVVERENLVEETSALAGSLATGPTAAFGRTKRLLRSAVWQDLALQLDGEKLAFIESAQTADFLEGVSAFLEKRKANFCGC